LRELTARGTYVKAKESWSQTRSWFATGIRFSVRLMQREWAKARGIPKLPYPRTADHEQVAAVCREDWLALGDEKRQAGYQNEVCSDETARTDHVRRARPQGLSSKARQRIEYRVGLRLAIENALVVFTPADCLAIRDRLILKLQYDELAERHPTRSTSEWNKWFKYRALPTLRERLAAYQPGRGGRHIVPRTMAWTGLAAVAPAEHSQHSPSHRRPGVERTSAVPAVMRGSADGCWRAHTGTDRPRGSHPREVIPRQGIAGLRRTPPTQVQARGGY
jgi:hypothetical protein